MTQDVEGIKRFVIGYYKIPNKYGGYPLAVKYELLPIPLSWLQGIFEIDPHHEDPGVSAMIDGYEIDEVKANKLQHFVKEKIDLEKYSFMLQCESGVFTRLCQL